MSAEATSGQLRRRVIFRGRVQGVGFRATTAALADRYRVSGFVRNLTDGSVELEAQGVADEVERFVAKVQRTFQSEIRETNDGTVPTKDGDLSFSIRH